MRESNEAGVDRKPALSRDEWMQVSWHWIFSQVETAHPRRVAIVSRERRISIES
jgi:hypothetical protein